MNKKIRIAVFVLCFITLIFNTAFFIKDQLFFGLNDLPKGNYVYPSMSPNNDKTALFYRVDTPLGSGARIEIVTHNAQGSAVKKETVYWNVGKSNVQVSWIDNNIISVDGKNLDLSKGDTYDCRRKASFSQKW